MANSGSKESIFWLTALHGKPIVEKFRQDYLFVIPAISDVASILIICFLERGKTMQTIWYAKDDILHVMVSALGMQN